MGGYYDRSQTPGGEGIPEGGSYIVGLGSGYTTLVYNPPYMRPGIPTIPVLTPSGGHCNTYGWQVDSTHPIGMLSCDVYVYSL